VTDIPPDRGKSTYLLPAYTELCNSYHAIDDFRTKLLGFLPLVTGGGLVLLTGRAEDVRREFFGPVGTFGIVITLGLLAYELFGIKKCHALIQAGKDLEEKMDLPVDGRLHHVHKPAGQFIRRPNNLLWVVNEPFAAALIYPAVLAAWTYLALLYERQSLGTRLSIVVFVAGFALILLYDGFLRLRDRLERRPSSGAEFQRTGDHASQAVSE
jgi:hypothetical protein